MSVAGVGSRSSILVQSLVDMRARLNELQGQFGSGKKADTYAGLGADAGFAVGLRVKLNAIIGYSHAITNVGARLDIQQMALARIAELGRTVKGSTRDPIDIDATGQTAAQRAAYAQLDEVVGLLNTQVGDRYLFSGRVVDKPAVASTDAILNGDGVRAGLKQIIAERAQADLGTSGLGRLQIPAAVGTTVSISEETPATVFGFKLAGATSTMTGTTVTGPGAPPASISVNVASNPNAGESITFAFDLPDGTSETLTLKATNAAPPGAGEFTIGATPAQTATNLQAALSAATGKLAATSLQAASAKAAASDFFASNPPMRVAGPPFASATAVTPGTSLNTVAWYTGEISADPARGSAVAQIDDALSVSYGARANEEALRVTVENVALFAAMTFSPSDPNAADRFTALTSRLNASLDEPQGQQKIEHIQAELTYAQTTMQSATERQQQRKATLQGLIDSVEGISQEEVAAQILALQTRLQASLQTTAMLYQMSIVNYL